MRQCFCLFIFYHSAISFSFPSFSYIIWNWVNRFAYSFFAFSYFFSSFIHIYMKSQSFAYSFFAFSYFFPFLHFIYNMKLVNLICLFFFSHSAISFSFPSFSYIIWSWVNRFAYSFFCIQLFLFPFLHLHI